MGINLKYYSFKNAKEILSADNELEEITNSIYTATSKLDDLTRPNLTERFNRCMISNSWKVNLKETENIDIDFYKNEIASRLRIGHPKFIGGDLLEFELASLSMKHHTKVAVYVVVTSNFRKQMIEKYHIKWEASITFEKAIKEMERYSPVIHVPVLLIGIDLN